jgi:flagellar biosynthesis protein FlhG
MLKKLKEVSARFDNVVIDTAAGIDVTTMSLASSASEVIVIANPEALSLADAYAAIKILSTQHRLDRVFLVPNAVRSKSEADHVTEQLKMLANRFLDVEVVALPYVPFDPLIPLAGASGKPLILSHPDSPASRAIGRIARLMNASIKEPV